MVPLWFWKFTDIQIDKLWVNFFVCLYPILDILNQFLILQVVYWVGDDRKLHDLFMKVAQPIKIEPRDFVI